MTIKREDVDRRALKIPRPRPNDTVLGRRAVSTATALRLGRHFGTAPEFRINLQTRHELDVAEGRLRLEIEREIEPCATSGNPDSLDRAGAESTAAQVGKW